MSTLIADARRAVGWSMRDLAEHLDVNVSSVSRMEASECDGTIGVGTLNRALEVMEFNLRLASRAP
ncbi:helix-turn-helix domain-containing protein [Agromyces sp. Soil535]|uniref:helix-turn-helix domain-containing protein n=1 Tax=Agromyces sp. Soil535 TaxID=1736390 RepID=UPI00138EFE5F|nr:helix-turn-helix domain-containing protein [Agromyces sp. Soil535]